MKVAQLTAALIAAAVMVPAFANGTQANAAPQGNPAAAHNIPQTPEQWLERMTDFTRNASAYRDPKVFVPWSNAVTEPGFYTQMGVNMMEPNNWYRMFGSMMDPRSLTNYMQFADPNMYAKWMAASMDPNFYTALMTQWADPGKMMRWAMMPLDPKVWGMMMQGMNPAMYMKWMMAPLDPRAISLAMQPMNPNLYTSWMGQAMNPQTYGAWGQWLNPSNYTVPGMGGMGGPTTAGAPSFNFFDPNSWFGMMAPGYGQPGGAPVAAAPAPMFGAVPGYGQPGVAPAGTFNFFDPNAWSNMWNPAAWTGAPAAQPAPAAWTGAAPVAQPAPAARTEDREADRSHPMTFVKDSIITAKIKAKLAAEHPGSLAHISVDTDKDGNVRLSGTANTQEEINAAVDTARSTEGVKSVWIDLTVKSDR
ncbi:MAG: BON domain-containing protein [Thiobacillaceae bacterium]